MEKIELDEQSISIIKSIWPPNYFFYAADNPLKNYSFGFRYLNNQFQTFDDFEFIIVDDINEINTSKYILSLSEKFNRIKILKNKINQGLTKSLVSAIEIANGEYIARQDADDISHPNRIYEQVKYLDKYNKVVLIGTGYSVINKQNKTVTEIVNSYNHNEIC